MIDFQTVVYVLIMLVLISFLFSFWLIIVWVGLVHCYIYLTEWRNSKKIAKAENANFFKQVEEFKSDFK